MSKQSRISREKSIHRTKTLFEIFLTVSVIGAGGYIIKGIAERSQTVGYSQYYAEPETSEEEELPDPDKVIYETYNVPTKDKFHGNLILVNENYRYFSGDEKLVSINEMNAEKGRTLFSAVDPSETDKMMIVEDVYEPMASMIFDFYDATQISNILIYGAYRSTDFQQQLYEDDLAATGNEESTRVAKAGFSEHESGLAFDITTYPDYDYQGEGEYVWLTENCYKYGLIIRYPENKEQITKIQSEPWHFRYVGKPHAYYMTKNNLCLEEYIDMIITKYYYQNDEHLEFTDDNGNEYEVYFVLSDDASDVTTIPVPTGKKFEVSGTNVNGFIVTVYKNENTEQPITEPTTVSEEESTGESETSESTESAEITENTEVTEPPTAYVAGQ
ncbi:MAG: M15 family metallopeptidase [Ruminococcus sp.]|nr:M15 family metallopeptidase [Ruminococcus sp.]